MDPTSVLRDILLVERQQLALLSGGKAGGGSGITKISTGNPLSGILEGFSKLEEKKFSAAARKEFYTTVRDSAKAARNVTVELGGKDGKSGGLSMAVGGVKGQLMNMAMQFEPVSGILQGFSDHLSPLQEVFQDLGDIVGSGLDPEMAQFAGATAGVTGLLQDLATGLRTFFANLDKVNIHLGDFIWMLVAGPLPWFIWKMTAGGGWGAEGAATSNQMAYDNWSAGSGGM